jgi:hypothetical protein
MLNVKVGLKYALCKLYVTVIDVRACVCGAINILSYLTQNQDAQGTKF